MPRTIKAASMTWGGGQANITSRGYSRPNGVFGVGKYLSRYFSVLEYLYGPSGPQTAGVYLASLVRLNGGESKRQRYRLDPETVPDETEPLEPPSGSSPNRPFRGFQKRMLCFHRKMGLKYELSEVRQAPAYSGVLVLFLCIIAKGNPRFNRYNEVGVLPHF